MESRLKNKKLIISAAMLAVYTVLTFIGALNHEIWYDEGQAWCIARDNDIAGIINLMKYEGHPPLWHFILYPFAQSGVSAEILPFISWFISVITVALILWKSPFGLVMNAAVVFSGGFIFYNSVTSRVYCLIPLILCLIAIIYPKRKEHPLLFGLLIALLTNTHIIMSGLVGAFGIFMIIDLFKDWKGNTKKQNVLNLCGLAIAGIGVVCLLLPTIQSLFVSHAVTSNEFTANVVLSRILNSLYNIILYIIPFEGYNVGIYLLCNTLAVIVIILFIFLRHYKKHFIAAVIFTAIYIVMTQVIYNVMHPTRATIYIFTLFTLYWIARTSDKPSEYEYSKFENRADSKIINKLLNSIISLDKSCDKTISVLIAFLMLASVPRGVISLVKDYTGDFCLSESVADFIDRELPDDTVIVAEKEYTSQLSALLPNTTFYYIQQQKFVTYHTYSVLPEIIDWDKVYNDLKEYEHVYYLAMYKNEYQTNRSEVLYSNYTDAEEIVQLAFVEITPIDVEKEIIPLIGTDKEFLIE